MCGMIFYYTCLVMGMASACRLYTEFADMVCWIIVNNNQELFMDTWTHPGETGILLTHYIDDFFGGHATYSGAWEQFIRVLWWWAFLGIPTQAKKCMPPSRILVYLGYVLNTWKFTVGIAPKRLQKYWRNIKIIRYMHKMNTPVRVHFLQKLVGQFRSLQVIYPYIIPFLRSWEQISSLIDKDLMAKISNRMIRDLDVIEAAVFDISAEDMPMWWLIYPKNSGDFEIFTDAATLHGVGGYIKTFNGRWFQYNWVNSKRWHNPQPNPDIVFMELLGVVAAACIWGHTWAGKAIKFRCDNWGACCMVIKKCACFNRPDLNALLAILCSKALLFRFYFWITHIKGVKNIVADKLSRLLKLLSNDVPVGASLCNKETDCKLDIEILLDCWYNNIPSYNYLCECDELEEDEWDLHNILKRDIASANQ